MKTLTRVLTLILSCRKHCEMQNRILGNLTLRSTTLLNSHDGMQKCSKGSHISSMGKQREKSEM